MMSRSSLGRYSRTRFSRSRNLVAVRTLVAICWRRVAMIDYRRRSNQELSAFGKGKTGRGLRGCDADHAALVVLGGKVLAASNRLKPFNILIHCDRRSSL